MRATAFLMRSIRQDSRLVTHHLTRAAMAATILYLFWVQFATYSNTAAVGGLFASRVVLCCYWFLTLVGSVHFSTAIVEEKEEQTLPLLRMTGASAFSILAGKSLPRLAMTLLFLAVIAPFLILSITLGGVLPLGLVSTILAIVCYSFMLSQVGLFAGVVAGRAPRAFTITGLLWLAIELSDWWYWLAEVMVTQRLGDSEAGRIGRWLLHDVFGWVPSCTLIGTLDDQLLSFVPSETWQNDQILPVRLWLLLTETWNFQMGFQLGTGVFFFLLSWLLFERCTSHAASSGDGGVSRAAMTRQSSRRVWSNALAWKSWQYAAGGWSWFLFRLIAAPVILFGLSFGMASVVDRRVDPEAVAILLMWLGILFGLINFGRLAGRLFNPEIHQKTLASLLMLPQTTGEILWATARGVLPAVLAGASTAVLGVLFAFQLHNDLDDLIEMMMEPWMWATIMWFVVSLHVGVLLTVWVRYGGMVLGFVICWILVPMCCISAFSVMAFGGGVGPSSQEFFRYVVPLGFLLGQAVMCVIIHRQVIARLEQLAAG